MNPRLLNWILAGALAGSLALWTRGLRAPAPAAATTGCASASCSFDLGALELSPEQRERLAALCGPEACGGGALEREAEGRCAALFEALASPAADAEELRARARELGALRTRELEGCIETVLAVREVLGEEQLRTLLESCCVRGGT